MLVMSREAKQSAINKAPNGAPLALRAWLQTNFLANSFALIKALISPGVLYRMRTLIFSSAANPLEDPPARQ